MPFQSGGGHGGGGIQDGDCDGLSWVSEEEGKSLCGVLFVPDEESKFIGDDRFGNSKEHEALDVIIFEKYEGEHVIGGGGGGGGGGRGGADGCSEPF